MRAREIMQQGVLSVSPELPLKDFEELLTSEGISGAPVTAGDGSLVGIASKTDIVRALSEQVSDQLLEAGLTVEDVMTPDVVTIRPDVDVKEIAGMMIDGGLHRIVVADDDGVIGIVTALDLLRLLR